MVVVGGERERRKKGEKIEERVSEFKSQVKS
jgi:hypothetical protein